MARNELEHLLIRIEADVSQLKTALGGAATLTAQTATRVQGSLAGMDRSFGMLKRTLGTFGIGLGASFLASFISRTIESGGALGELAQQAGVTTDTLQVLTYAGTQYGVSAEQIQTSTARLTRTIGEAADGNKQAIAAFNELGVGVLDASGHIRSTDDVLADVAAGLGQIADPATRARLEFDLLGRSGQKLDPILSQGKAGLDNVGQAARDLGVVLSAETIQRLDDAADRMAKLELVVTRFGQWLLAGGIQIFIDFLSLNWDRPVANLVTASMSPKLKEAAEALMAAQQALQTEGEQLRHMPHGMGQATIDARLAPLKAAVEEAQRTFTELQKLEVPPAPSKPTGGTNNPPAETKETKERKASLDQLIASMNEERRLLVFRGDELERQKALGQAAAAAQSDFAAKLRSSATLTDDERNALMRNVEAHLSHDRVMKEDALSTAAFEKAQSVLGSLIDPQTAALTTYNEQMRALDLLLDKGAISYEAYGAAAERAREALDKMGPLAKELANNLGEEVGGALSDLVAGLDTLENVGKRVFAALTDALLKFAFSADGLDLGGQASKWLMGLLGLGGGGGGVFAGASVGTGPGRLASGGPAMAGHPYIIGEKGPELWMPDVSGTVVPFDRLGGGRQTMHITMNIGQGVTPEQLNVAFRKIDELRRQVPSIAVETVLNAKQRSRGYADALTR